MRSPFTFKKYGQSGMDVSELFPHVGECADDICVVRSVYTDIPNHEPSLLMMNTGHTQVGRPSMGAWLTYGLGSENQNLPGLRRPLPRGADDGRPAAVEQRVPAGGEPGHVHRRARSRSKNEIIGKDFDPKKLVSYMHNDEVLAAGAAARDRPAREARQACAAIDRIRSSKPRSSRWKSPTGCRPRRRRSSTSARKRKATLEMYGAGQHRAQLPDGRPAGRRSGVRMVQVYYAAGDPWDHHGDIQAAPQERACDSDRPFAAVIKDLKSRGLFNDTLVVCGSEFGRTPVAEVGSGRRRQAAGRDHNPFGFTMWLAGGGIKGGTVYGATDDFGFKAIEKPVHVHDLHATILHLLGSITPS